MKSSLKIPSLLSFSLIIGFTACTNSIKKKKETKVIISNTSESINIPFTVAENYFSKSKESIPTTTIIRSQEELEQHLGMATTMGSKGKPTAIDFNQSFLVVVSEPSSNVQTEIHPISLVADKKGDMTFSYEVIKGEEQSYETKPVLAIIISNKNQGKISYDRIEK